MALLYGGGKLQRHGEMNPFKEPLGDILRATVQDYIKNGGRIQEQRELFSGPDLPARECTSDEMHNWLAMGVEWRVHEDRSYFDKDARPQVLYIARMSTLAFTQYARAIATGVFHHFLGISNPNRSDWVLMGNLIGFNGHGDGIELVDSATDTSTKKPTTERKKREGTAPATEPRKAGSTKRVWEIADSLTDASRATVLAACEREGINKHTAQTQYYRWSSAKKAKV